MGVVDKMKVGLARAISAQLRCPTSSLGGTLVARHFQRQSSFLEKGAVNLLNIQPDDKVLEVGFGGGVGLRAAYWRVAEGNGVIHGVERSHYMLEKAKKFCALEIAEGKVFVHLALVSHLPFPDAFFDRVFHCDSFYFWSDLIAAAKELKRVMRPGGTMVATLSFDDLRAMDEKGYLQQATNTDPLDYMLALESVGFRDVHVKYMTGAGGGSGGVSAADDEKKSYQGIFATRPTAAEEAVAIENEDDSSFEMQEEQFRLLMSKVHAAEVTRRSNRPAAPGYDPLSNESKIPKSRDDDNASLPPK